MWGIRLKTNTRKQVSMKLFTSICALFLLPQALSNSLQPSDFAKDYLYQQAKLSPDGKKIGLIVKVAGRRILAVIDSDSLTNIANINLGDRAEIGEFYWATNKRIVAELWQRQPWQAESQFYGELFAVDYNGKHSELIYSYRAEDDGLGSRLKKKQAIRGWANIISVLPEDKKHILISSTEANKHGGAFPTIHKLNIHNGKISRAITRSPVPYTSFIADEKGNLSFAKGTNKDGVTQAFRYKDGDWIEISDTVGEDFRPLTLNSINNTLFYLDDYEQDKRGLFTLDLVSGKKTSVYTDKHVDITGISRTTDGTAIYALRLEHEYPVYVMLDSEHNEANVFKRLLNSFPGYRVEITSKSEDGNKWLIYIVNDIDAGSYYIYDLKSNMLNQIAANHEHIDIDLLAKTQPFSFSSFDNKTIHGFITYPNSMTADEQVPLVALIHGGPHDVRDTWYYDRETQMLASLGYAVLRVNYRGSSGYGNEYSDDGYGEWGDAIQKDILGGIQWTLNNGNIASDKICIMGASFGGYAAVMAATLEPDLFQCIVATAGVYDLQMMYKKGDIPQLLFAEEYLERAIGTDPKKLKASSPINRVEHLKADIFIAHGERDRRVPVQHALALKKQLDLHNKSYEWFVKSTETHGFFNESNRAEYYENVAIFLKKHLN